MPATHRQLLLALSLLLLGLIFPASQAGGAAWAWQYDTLGQLTNASREQDAAAVAGAQFAYSYDGIGNRLAASRGDTPDAASHAEQKTYTPNLLNQYTSRTQPGTVTVSGVANAAATVTVNGQPTQRGPGVPPVDPPAPGTTAQLQASFAATFSVANASGPAVFDATILATQNGVTEHSLQCACHIIRESACRFVRSVGPACHIEESRPNPARARNAPWF